MFDATLDVTLDVMLLAETLPNDPPQWNALATVVAMLLSGSFVTWFRIFGRWRRGEPAIAPTPRHAVPWQAIEVFVVIGFLTLSTVGGALMPAPEEPQRTLDDFSRLFLMGSAFNIVLASAVAMFLVVVRSATASDLGLVPNLPHDLIIGSVGWLAALVPVYALQLALVNLVEQEDRQTHPLVQTLIDSPRIDVLLLAVFSAVIVAPLVEEFFYRVLLQGWLEKQFAPRQAITTPPAIIDALPADVVSADTLPADVDAPIAANVPQAIDVPQAIVVPEAAIAEPMPAAPEPPPTEPPPAEPPRAPNFQGWRGIAPIAISAFLFAAAHAGTWPDPVPLFALALALGYLYRQTHQLWPSVLLHMLFNGLSLAIVWFGRT